MADESNGMGMGMVVALLLVAVVAILFFMFRGSTPQQSTTPSAPSIEVPDQIDVNVDGGQGQ